MRPPHLMIYEKPRRGRNFLNRYTAYQYTHRKVAQGGDESASCVLHVNRAEAEYIYENLIGNVVQAYAENPFEPIWEGFISRVTYRAGGVVLTRGLDDMANRIGITYTYPAAAGATKTQQTTKVSDAASIALYGVKVTSIDGLIHYGLTTEPNHKSVLRNRHLSKRKFPQVSTASGNASDALIEIEMQGLQYMAWDWHEYSNGDETEGWAEDIFKRVTVRTDANAPENGTFIYKTAAGDVSDATRLIGQNRGWNMSRANKTGTTHLQFIKSLVEPGDGVNGWVFGITPLVAGASDRYVYYRKANTVVRYTVHALRDVGRVRDQYGNVLPGWSITPDNGIFVADILAGYNSSGDDPRLAYIDSVEWNAETGAVSWQSGDNITTEGVLQKDRYFKDIGRPFGAPPRRYL